MKSGPPKYKWPIQWPSTDRVPPAALGLIITLVLLFIIIGVVGSIGTIVRFFDALIKNDHVAIRNVGFIFVAVFGAPFVIWRALVAQGTLNRAKDRDYADLFTKAIEQIGATREITEYPEKVKISGEPELISSEIKQEVEINKDELKITKPNIEVRLGAIYALERISRDSESDHLSVMETICAYIRENAPPESAKEYTSIYNEVKPPRTDIMAAISVICRRDDGRVSFERQGEKGSDKYNIDLRKANLRRQSFNSAKLNFANFNGAYLDGAGFTAAHMNNVRMRFAVLKYADFTGAELQRADLSFADMTYAKGITIEMLKSCFGCEGTKLPNGFPRPRDWPRKKLDNRDQSEKYYQAWLSEGGKGVRELELSDAKRAQEEQEELENEIREEMEREKHAEALEAAGYP